jgi:hypothetical protein
MTITFDESHDCCAPVSTIRLTHIRTRMACPNSALERTLDTPCAAIETVREHCNSIRTTPIGRWLIFAVETVLKNDNFVKIKAVPRPAFQAAGALARKSRFR